eukprot:4563676-Pleurochrysis_carterae.AAC.1
MAACAHQHRIPLLTSPYLHHAFPHAMEFEAWARGAANHAHSPPTWLGDSEPVTGRRGGYKGRYMRTEVGG